jgi:hypothetical protein
VPLDGPHGAVLAGQRSVLLREGDNTRVLAPVTSRGEAVGVLELVLPFAPARSSRPGLPLMPRWSTGAEDAPTFLVLLLFVQSESLEIPQKRIFRSSVSVGTVAFGASPRRAMPAFGLRAARR